MYELEKVVADLVRRHDVLSLYNSYVPEMLIIIRVDGLLMFSKCYCAF